MGALALGAILVSSAASAVTVDTFDFTLSTGWTRDHAGTPVADPGASLVGSFVGVVEPDPLGTIALGDLTAFSASFTDSEGFAIGGATLQSGLSTLTLFRYETLGGAGTLSFAQLGNVEKGNACVGFFSFLSDATCAFFEPLFPGANAFILTAGVRYGSTADLPTITLVSSVTTPPAAVPEPGSWALFGIGVVSIALIRRRKTRTAASARRRREAMAYLA
jgi:PEP-CTERM motif